jgi:hypothetical protein
VIRTHDLGIVVDDWVGSGPAPLIAGQPASSGGRSLEGLEAADRHLGQASRMRPTLVHRTRRIRQEQRDTRDHGDGDGRGLTKSGGQGKKWFALLEDHLMADRDGGRRPPLVLGERDKLYESGSELSSLRQGAEP